MHATDIPSGSALYVKFMFVKSQQLQDSVHIPVVPHWQLELQVFHWCNEQPD